jgi:hypothetical protein
VAEEIFHLPGMKGMEVQSPVNGEIYRSKFFCHAIFIHLCSQPSPYAFQGWILPFSPSCAIVREAFFLFFKWRPFLRVGFLDPQVKNKSQGSVRQGKDIILCYLPHSERENIIVLKVAEVFSYHAIIVVAQETGIIKQEGLWKRRN